MTGAPLGVLMETRESDLAGSKYRGGPEGWIGGLTAAGITGMGAE